LRPSAVYRELVSEASGLPRVWSIIEVHRIEHGKIFPLDLRPQKLRRIDKLDTLLRYHGGLPVRVGIPRSSKEREMADRPSTPLAYDSNIERTTCASASLIESGRGNG
jgi:hypothetical protein